MTKKFFKYHYNTPSECFGSKNNHKVFDFVYPMVKANLGKWTEIKLGYVSVALGLHKQTVSKSLYELADKFDYFDVHTYTFRNNAGCIKRKTMVKIKHSLFVRTNVEVMEEPSLFWKDSMFDLLHYSYTPYEMTEFVKINIHDGLNFNESCFVSMIERAKITKFTQSQMAKWLECTTRTVRRVLSSLTSKGVLGYENKHKKGILVLFCGDFYKKAVSWGESLGYKLVEFGKQQTQYNNIIDVAYEIIDDVIVDIETGEVLGYV